MDHVPLSSSTERLGKEQWRRWPETTVDGSGDPERWGGVHLTAFWMNEPPDWFVCVFYQQGLHRQRAQQGAFSTTARFGRHHAAAIAALLREAEAYRRYVISAGLKPELRRVLRELHDVRGRTDR